MITSAHLLVIILHYSSFPSAIAFATARLSSRAELNQRLHNPPDESVMINAKVRAPSFQLSDKSPSQSTSMDVEPDIIHQITTVVGKTASTVVSASFFLLLAHHRDAVILTLWIGSILNAVLSKVAKKLLNHERPAELQNSDRIKMKPSDGGMPSSHAMSVGFIGTSILGGVVPVESRLIVGLAMVAYSAMALRYRVRDHLHTSDQIAVGLVLGIGNALLWLRFGLGANEAGPILSWVQNNCVSAETGLFPYSALAIPIVVGILVVGSFERRIALWMKNNRRKEE